MELRHLRHSSPSDREGTSRGSRSGSYAAEKKKNHAQPAGSRRIETESMSAVSAQGERGRIDRSGAVFPRRACARLLRIRRRVRAHQSCHGASRATLRGVAHANPPVSSLRADRHSGVSRSFRWCRCAGRVSGKEGARTHEENQLDGALGAPVELQSPRRQSVDGRNRWVRFRAITRWREAIAPEGLFH